jgi:hypothetical protein
MEEKRRCADGGLSFSCGAAGKEHGTAANLNEQFIAKDSKARARNSQVIKLIFSLALLASSLLVALVLLFSK